jgi:hypothetical protein
MLSPSPYADQYIVQIKQREKKKRVNAGKCEPRFDAKGIRDLYPYFKEPKW